MKEAAEHGGLDLVPVSPRCGQVRQFADLAEEREFAALAEEFPYLAEVVAGHVAMVGYDFAAAFENGLDLILDGLEERRVAKGVR